MFFCYYFNATGCFYDGECDDNRIDYVADPATSVNFNVDNLKVISLELGQISNSTQNISEFDQKYQIRNSNSSRIWFRNLNSTKFNCRIWSSIVEFGGKQSNSVKNVLFRRNIFQLTIEENMNTITTDGTDTDAIWPMSA